jgi:Family of unknown function (DUF6308)
MNIGSRKIVVDEAFAQLRLYAETNPAVLRYYDGLPGLENVGGIDPDKVTLDDLARAMVIGSDLKANDIPWLVEVDAEKEFAAIPVRAQLEDAVPGSELFEAATALDEKFSGHRGFGQAKKSKLLHLKRPYLFPISDSFVRMTYRDAVAGADFLAAVHRDLVNTANVQEFDRLEARLEHEPTGSPAQLLSEAPRLRLLDILASLLGEAK